MKYITPTILVLHYLVLSLQCIIIYQNFHLIDVKGYMTIIGMALAPLAKVIVKEIKEKKQEKLNKTDDKLIKNDTI